MLNLLIVTFAVVVQLFSLGTRFDRAEKSVSQSLEPILSIDLNFSAKERFPLKSLKLSISAPDGRTSWEYMAEGAKEVDTLMKDGSVLAKNWYTAPGNYFLDVSYNLEGPDSEVKQVKQQFLAVGDELRTTADLWFIDDAERRQSFLADLTIRRFIPSTGGVWLTRDWTPARQGMPRYHVFNSTDYPIYGVSWLGNYFGRIQHLASGRWIPYRRGGFCGTVGLGKPIKPNESVGSIEGYFIGHVNPFVNGRYKYVVQYSLSPTRNGVPTDLVNKGLTRKQVLEIYEVSAEFYIESNQE